MAIFTSILNLLKKNPATDGTDTFNIQTMLNDNWDKIDAAMAMQAVDGDVRVATTANIALSGLQTIDGIVLVAGDRVLVKNQTTGSQNGIYVAASGSWSRAADADSTAKIASGISVYVRSGTANVGKTFTMNNTAAVTLGTTAITFAEITSGYLDQSVKTTASPTFVKATAATFASTQATGTAPFTVASQTLVTNLNADMVDGWHTSFQNDANTVALRNSSGNIAANAFVSQVAQGNAPLNVTSTTLVANLNADLVDGYHVANGGTSTVAWRDGNGVVNANGFNASGTIISSIGTSAGGVPSFAMRSAGGSSRWQIGQVGVESTGNSGGDFALWNYADDGTFISRALGIERKTGNASFTARLAAGGDIATSSGGVGVATLSGNLLGFNRASANYLNASSAAGYLNFVVNGDAPNDTNAALRLAADYSANFRGKVVAPQFSDGRTFSFTVGEVVFGNSGTNQKADLYFTGNFYGYIDITLTGNWNAQSNSGNLTKRIATHLSGTSVMTQETRYVEVLGDIKSRIAISDVTYDATNSRWRVQISYKGSSTLAETFAVKVEGYTQVSAAATAILGAKLSAVYTTDATVFPAAKVTSPDLVAKSASVSEFNVTSASYATFLTANSVAAGNYQAFIYLRVTATTTVSVAVNYTDVTGTQTTVVVSAQNFTAGSYSLLPVFFNATANSNVILQASSSVSGAVKVSASIMGV